MTTAVNSVTSNKPQSVASPMADRLAV